MIKKIRVQNFKCFLDSTIEFNHLTILAGSNAVGKSSLIQSLLLIRQTIETLGTTFLRKDIPKLSSQELIEVPLNGNFGLNLGDSSQVLSSSADSEYISFIINGTMPFKFLVSKESHDTVIMFEDSPKLFDDDLSILQNEFHYLNAERLGPRVAQDIVNQRFSSTGTKGEYTGLTLSTNHLFRVDEKRRFESKKTTVPNLNKQVEYWLDFVIPGIEVSTKIYHEIGRVGFYLRRTYSDTSPLNPNNVGFGVSYVLPIIVSGLLAQNGCLLIVENPEAHLHPSGQSKIGQFLAKVANSGVQIIVETHSEHVINGIRIACLKNTISNKLISINYFSMEEKSRTSNVEHLTLNEFGDLSYWPNGFFDQEEKDLAEIFESRMKESTKDV